MKNRNWNEFWGPFLQVKFHEGNPELWPSRERKAKWFEKHANLKHSFNVLDLGCGDGLIDICLGRMGYFVTAVDKGSTVLEIARKKDDSNRVIFKESGIDEIEFDADSFESALVIETLGLMSIERDTVMLSKVYSWLKYGRILIVDSPENLNDGEPWQKEFDEGVVRGESKFDPETRIQNIQFYYRPRNEEEFGLLDSYEPSRGVEPGIKRFIYKKEELAKILTDIGFYVEEIEHYYPKGYFALKCVKI